MSIALTGVSLIVIAHDARRRYLGDTLRQRAMTAAVSINQKLEQMLISMKFISLQPDLIAEESELESWLETIKKHNEGFQWLLVLDRTGQRIALVNAPGKQPPTDMMQFAAFRKPMDDRTAYTGPVTFDRQTDASTMIVSFPLQNDAGQAHGVLIASIQLGFLRQILDRMHTAHCVYIVDRRGVLIARNDLGNTQFTPQQVDHPYPAETQSGVARYKGLDGNQVLGTTIKINATSWNLYWECPLGIAYASLRKMVAYTVLIILMAMILGVLASFYLARRFARPLKEFMRFAHALGRGEPTEAFSAFRTRELHILSEAFGEMDHKLREREAELRQSRERFRALVETTADWIWEMDDQMRFTYASPRIKDLLGYEPDVWIGRSRPEMATDEVREALMDRLGHAHRHRQPFANISADYRHKDGSIVTLESVGIPFFDQNGQLLGYRGVDRDISGRKLADEQRRLFETRVQEARKLESLGMLAGGIAHDFNNLLVGVLGHADLALADVPADSPICANLKAIQDAALQARVLCNEMLAFSGKGRFVVETIDLNQFLRESEALLTFSMSADARLRMELTADKPCVEADRTQLRQLIMHLTTNAAEAMTESNNFIKIRTAVVEADEALLTSPHVAHTPPKGRYVMLEVQDQGHGMNADIQRRIFEPFFSTRGLGRGLGLAACLGIVKGHGGTIKVSSETGRGSCFQVYLPVSSSAVRKAVAARQEQGRVQRSVAARIKHGPREDKGTILVADDEEIVRSTVRMMLRREGFKVLLAEDGVQCLERYEKHRSDICLVLLDLSMPRMDGEQTLRELKKINPDVPVLLASGYNEQDLSQLYTAAGSADFIQKPFQIKQLIAKLYETLHKNQGPNHG